MQPNMMKQEKSGDTRPKSAFRYFNPTHPLNYIKAPDVRKYRISNSKSVSQSRVTPRNCNKCITDSSDAMKIIQNKFSYGMDGDATQYESGSLLNRPRSSIENYRSTPGLVGFEEKSKMIDVLEVDGQKTVNLGSRGSKECWVAVHPIKKEKPLVNEASQSKI